MSRSLTCVSMCLGLALVSCDLLIPPPLLTASAPQAASPVVEAAVAEPAPRVAVPPTSLEPEPDAAFLMALGHLSSRHTGLSKSEVVELAETVVTEARRHDIDPQVILAVIQVESGGYNFAVSPVGAMGLMQIMPRTGEILASRLAIPWSGPDTLFDPTTNVKMGVAYLRELSDRFGSLSTALAAYNWGPTRIHRRIRRGSAIPSIYVGQVMKAYEVATQAGAAAGNQRSKAVSPDALSTATSAG